MEGAFLTQFENVSDTGLWVLGELLEMSEGPLFEEQAWVDLGAKVGERAV